MVNFRSEMGTSQNPEIDHHQRVAVDEVRVRMLPDGRMDRKNAAKYLGHAKKTLAQWVTQGKGPRLVKVGGRVFYFRDDLDEFIRAGSGGR
jgi:hypothetical protein